MMLQKISDRGGGACAGFTHVGRGTSDHLSLYTPLGFPIDPVCIETEDGRREYQRLQQQLYEWGLPIRRRLLRIYDAFFALVEREAGG